MLTMCLMDDESWITDSEASSQFTYNLKLPENISELKEDCFVKLANGRTLMVKYSESCQLNDDMILQDVLHVLEFKVNLISVNNVIEDTGFLILFNKATCMLHDPSHKTLLKTSRASDGLYYKESFSVCSVSVNPKNNGEYELWHFKLAHASFDSVRKVLRHETVVCSSHDVGSMVCPFAKKSKLSFL